MKLKLILFVMCLLQACCLTVEAQKKPIDNNTWRGWERLGAYKITNDGRYVSYLYNSSAGSTLVLSSTNGTYKKNIPDAFEAWFTEDSHFLIFNSAKGLAILKIGTEEPQYIAGAALPSFPKEGNGRWLAYKLKDDLCLRDLSNGTEKTYTDVLRSWFNDQGTVLLLQTKTSVIWVNLPDGSQKTICQAAHATNVAFDRAGTQLAFTAQKGEPINPLMAALAGNNEKPKKKAKPLEVSLCYFQKTMDSAMVKATNHSPGIEQGFIISTDAPTFSPNGKQLIFKLDREQPVIAFDTAVITSNVDVWNYKDPILVPEQVFGSKHHFPTHYTAVISVEKADKVLQLENEDAVLSVLPGNQYALEHNSLNREDNFKTYPYESFLYLTKQQPLPEYTLISLGDGSRETIAQQPTGFALLSPAEHFICWFDTLSKHYQTYEIATKITRSISTAVPSILYTRENNADSADQYGIAGWLANDEAVLVYDQYDIWQLDPTGKKAPINLTGGYGGTHHTAFRLATEGSSLQALHSGDPILVAVLDDAMHNGFCKIKTGVSAPPRLGRMQPCMFYFDYKIEMQPPLPLKAKNAEVYAMQQQSTTEAPNLVITKDLNTFTKLSDIHPQQDYNWMTSELMHWKMTDGRLGTGILYKPENFDSNKKYPVIVHYYLKRSGEMYQFKNPELSLAPLDITWYVSNGYLVFIPDIMTPTGHTTEGVLNSVESAGKYLASLPYVDATKMGLQGHSFGGYETNVVIAHCGLFAAAQEGAGPSDLVSIYGGLGFGDKSLNFMLETGEFNLGADKTPWQYPELYRQNSPIFFVDKITTPLLIMHNKDDGAVPVAQGVELFTALRRLQKPVWMLQYDREGHVIGEEENQLDFTIRRQQFFDHYLKGKPAPKWMTDGIPAKDKGLASGLQLDNIGK